MAATGDEHLWGFLRYARANPFNSLNTVHWDEIDAMAALYAPVNDTSGGSTNTTDPGTYDSTTDIPGKTTANTDTNGLGFETPTTALTDQALYPETHIFTAVPA